MEGVTFDKKMVEILHGYNEALKHMVDQIELISKQQIRLKEATEKALERVVEQLDSLNDRCADLEDCIGKKRH